MKSFIHKKAKTHLIGCGRMGGSILAAWIKKGYPLKNIFVLEPNPSVWLKKKSEEGLNLNVLETPDVQYCFLAVKPQSIEKIRPILKASSNKAVTFVSMLAGIEIKRISEEFNQKYFYNRSKEKNALAISSEQSKQIESYKHVIENYNRSLKNDDLKKCPEYWGGFSFTPYYFEFWEGHESRINKREIFNKTDGIWKHSFLQP